MIPKIIHYVWLGKNEKTELFKQCLVSWRRFFPEAKIIEWNEDNLKFIDNKYYLEALDRGKYAFASDYARLRILSEYGGFYFDTDLELINKVSYFCGYDFVCCTEKGPGNIYYPIMTAFIGSAPNNRVIEKFLKCYDDLSFVNAEGKENLTTNVVLLSNVLKEQFGIIDKIRGNTKINLSNDEVIFPYYYFSRLAGGGGKTYAIHHYAGSWVDKYSINVLIKLFNYEFMKIKSNKNFLDKRIENIFEKVIFRYDYISSGGRCGVYVFGRVAKK